MKNYEKPKCEEIIMDTQSTTVLGNCTHYSGGTGDIDDKPTP